MKILTIVGTRPEIIRLSAVIRRLDSVPGVEHILAHTGQNYDYELNQIFFDDLELRKPDHFLEAAGETACETVGNVIAKADRLMAEVEPDALLVLGDTNSCLAAYPAKRRKIPVFHMEAGNRCFDQRVPEEINRRIIDHLADVNMPYSSIAREYLLREGLPPDRVIKTGSPMKEVLREIMPKVESSEILEKLGLLGEEGRVEPFFVVSAHREENVDLPGRFEKLAQVLNGLAGKYGWQVIVTTHPRTRKRMEESGIEFGPEVEFHKPFGLSDYLALQLAAQVVLSDSGTVTEEASILGLKALNLRDAHERPEGMEEGVVVMTGLEWERVELGLGRLLGGEAGVGRGDLNTETQRHRGREGRKVVADYDVDDVAEKVVTVILSYTGYVNRVVWGRGGEMRVRGG